MKVVHLCPTYFSDDSFIAGAERYSYDLAKAMARVANTTLVTFGPKSFVRKDGGLIIKCFVPLTYFRQNKINPVAFSYLRELFFADVIHCHQFLTVTTDLALLLGLVLRRKVFVTDLAGATDFSLSYHLPLWKGIRSFLLISNFNRNFYRKFPVRAQVIYGGVDTSRFSPGQGGKTLRALHVGRILPYKGIHTLVRALPERVGLDIVGRPYDAGYYGQLVEQVKGKEVVFYTNLSDDGIIEKYRRSLVTVLPITADSGFTAALESMACGTPVIATRIGCLPEIVEHGVTGFLVAPNDPLALRERIEYFYGNPGVAMKMGIQGRERVLKEFTWERVVDRCLQAYKED